MIFFERIDLRLEILNQRFQIHRIHDKKMLQLRDLSGAWTLGKDF